MKSKSILSPSDFVLLPATIGAPTSMASFLAILKSIRLAPPYHFSYVGETGPLLSNMSLETNILHQFECPDIYQNQNLSAKISDILDTHRNPFLKEIFKKIDFPGLLAKNASEKQKKLTSLCMGMITSKPYLLLQNPEGWLGEEEQDLLESALLHERKLGTTILVSTENPERWNRLANKLLSRSEDLSFCVTSINHDLILNFVPAVTEQSSEDEEIIEQLAA